MEPTAWTLIGVAVVILIAIATSFRSLHEAMRTQGKDLQARIDDQGKDIREHIVQLRERMAHVEARLKMLHELITRIRRN